MAIEERRIYELETVVNAYNMEAAKTIIAKIKTEMGDDGKTMYAYECNVCQKWKPCRQEMPFRIPDAAVCIGGGIGSAQFKEVEQYQAVEDTPVEPVEEPAAPVPEPAVCVVAAPVMQEVSQPVVQTVSQPEESRIIWSWMSDSTQKKT